MRSYKYLMGSLVLGAATFSLQAVADEGESLDERVEMLEQQIELIADSMEGVVSEEAQSSQDGMPGHGHGSRGKTTVGGYGELHYANMKNNNSGGDDLKEMDLHRVILFVGHQFSDRIRFFSELEVEHSQAGDGKDGGEVAMEQAYLEFDLDHDLSSRAGLLLVPMGIINETHEPPTFYGVERNPIETKIIPSTWREGGVSLAGQFGQGFSYDFVVMSGLETSSASNYAIRSGRKSAREAPANDLAYNARLKWVAMPGLELVGGIQYQSDVTQGNDPDAGAATLVSTHMVWSRGPFGLRALYARWDLDGSGPKSVGADEQSGWYLEPAYKVSPKVGLFARYNTWDNQAGDSADSEYVQINAGLSYWPHPDVVIKADYETQDNPKGKDEFKGVNLGVGYQF